MKLMTLKSNDFVDYFDVNEFENTSRVEYSPKNWCGLRSTRVKQLTNMDMDFGMVFSKQNNLMHKNWQHSALDFHGYIDVCSIHVWNTQGDFLYDSQNQSKLCNFNLVGIGEEVGVVDASSMNELFRKWNPKNQDKVLKFFKKSLFNASRYGIQNVYFRGFCWETLKGAYFPPSTMKGNYEDWDVLVNQYFSKYSAVSK
jgi:hypothetical protein